MDSAPTSFTGEVEVIVEEPSPVSTTFYCCGVECVCNPGCLPTCPKPKCCLNFSHCRPRTAPCLCFKTVQFATFIAILVGSIYLIAIEQDEINVCREQAFEARYNCMVENRDEIAAYAFGFIGMFVSAFAIAKEIYNLWTWKRVEPSIEPLRCVDGKPNKRLCWKIGWIISFVCFVGGMFVTIFCSQFIDNQYDVNVPDSYKEPYHDAFTAGIIIGPLVMASPLLILLLFKKLK